MVGEEDESIFAFYIKFWISKNRYKNEVGGDIISHKKKVMIAFK